MLLYICVGTVCPVPLRKSVVKRRRRRKKKRRKMQLIQLLLVFHLYVQNLLAILNSVSPSLSLSSSLSLLPSLSLSLSPSLSSPLSLSLPLPPLFQSPLQLNEAESVKSYTPPVDQSTPNLQRFAFLMENSLLPIFDKMSRSLAFVKFLNNNLYI